MNKIKEILDKKIIKRLIKFFKAIAIIIILAFICVVYLQRFSNNELSFLAIGCLLLYLKVWSLNIL